MIRQALVLALLPIAVGCSNNQMLDLAMRSAPRSSRTAPVDRHGYQLLAGDLHTHVLPPDAPYHVSRQLPETLRLATEEGLDFVVLTPHVPSRFFTDPETREWVHDTQQVLRAEVGALTRAIGSRAPVVIVGMEYTDHRFGHVGLSFADVDEVLAQDSADELATRPALFFERWHAHGGIVTINHPVLYGVPNAPVRDLRFDLSWRGFARADENPRDLAARMTGFPEIAWISAHADAIETYNLAVAHLRDQFMIGDADWTMRMGTHLVDRVARAESRRITPVGGTDSHGSWLRPTTWVLATERTPKAIHDAIVSGRSCVRAPEACSLEVRGADGSFQSVGASVTSGTRRRIEARAAGGPSTYFVNGTIAAHAEDGELVEVAVPGECAVLRVAVGASESAPVYVDCPWGSRDPVTPPIGCSPATDGCSADRLRAVR